MGQGIAQVFAQSNYDVTVYNKNIEKCKKLKENIKYVLLNKAKKEEKEVEKILSKIKITESLQDAKGANLVIEAIVEDIDVKKKYFNDLEEIVEEKTILATNTSSLSITEISSSVKISERVIGMHFFNPAPLMKLVEVIVGLNTSQETIETIKKISLDIDKETVIIDEIPGFVVNRLLIPMINEAIFLLEKKVCTKEEIDKAMKLGANHPLGPLELSDLIGNDIVLKIMKTLYKETRDSKYRPSYLLKKYVNAGKLGRKVKEGFYKY